MAEHFRRYPDPEAEGKPYVFMELATVTSSRIHPIITGADQVALLYADACWVEQFLEALISTYQHDIYPEIIKEMEGMILDGPHEISKKDLQEFRDWQKRQGREFEDWADKLAQATTDKNNLRWHYMVQQAKKGEASFDPVYAIDATEPEWRILIQRYFDVEREARHMACDLSLSDIEDLRDSPGRNFYLLSPLLVRTRNGPNASIQAETREVLDQMRRELGKETLLPHLGPILNAVYFDDDKNSGNNQWLPEWIRAFHQTLAAHYEGDTNSDSPDSLATELPVCLYKANGMPTNPGNWVQKKHSVGCLPVEVYFHHFLGGGDLSVELWFDVNSSDGIKLQPHVYETVKDWIDQCGWDNDSEKSSDGGLGYDGHLQVNHEEYYQEEDQEDDEEGGEEDVDSQTRFADDYENPGNPYNRSQPYNPTKQTTYVNRKIRGNPPPGIDDRTWNNLFNSEHSKIYGRNGGRAETRALANAATQAAGASGYIRDRAIARLVGQGRLQQGFIDTNP